MLTLQDCLDMCELGPEVVEAIAEHEGLPAILAAELGNCLACSNGGLAVVHRFILDDIAGALQRGDRTRLASLEAALSDFRRRHPGVPALS